MNLIIITAGTYNDARRRAHQLQTGDPLVTSQDYGLSLIASGMARDAQEIIAAIEADDSPPKTHEVSVESNTEPTETPAEIEEVEVEPVITQPVTHSKRSKAK